MLAGVILRRLSGPVAGPARRRPVFGLLRLIAVLALVFVLAGPTWVDESPGKITRQDLFCLLDSSQSMDIGKERSRWDDAAAALDRVSRELPEEEQESLRLFRFGHRVSAVTPDQSLAALKPAETETRLAEAFRQMAGRFGQHAPAGLVLFSDGQVRNSERVREVARYYAARQIPIHVYPPPVTADEGDIALIAAVAPSRVRKYADVEVQVFLRSSGFSGQRTEVSLIVPAVDQQPKEILASVPVSLKGGVQSVPLSYRSDFKGRKFEVRAASLPGEISERNNSLSMDVQIERTKIRVLYIDGGAQLAQEVQSAMAAKPGTAPRAPLQQMLNQDEDIDCILLIRDKARGLTGSGGNRSAIGRFPAALTELCAYDCVILNNVPASRFKKQELEWLKFWVEVRGGGLIMAGGEDSFSAGGWKSTPLADMLPVELEGAQWHLADGKIHLQPVLPQGLHPIWQVVPERDANDNVLKSIPALPDIVSGLRPKPAAEILAVEKSSEGTVVSTELAPLIVTGQDGIGRTMAIAWDVGPAAKAFMTQWGPASAKNSEKFWRNVVYWVSERSSVGRRRLVATLDKRFYRPGETIQLQATAFNSVAQATTDYHVRGMIEPKSFETVGSELYSPVNWPEAVTRTSNEPLLRIVWGEEFELPRNDRTGGYSLKLNLAERLDGGLSDQNFRIELTAYEGGSAEQGAHGTQVDSTSLDVQVLDDPFEQQNTSTNFELLKELAMITGGLVLQSPEELAAVVRNLPVEVGPPMVHRTPMWPQWWLLATIGTALTCDWILRRWHGLA